MEKIQGLKKAFLFAFIYLVICEINLVQQPVESAWI